MIPIEKSQYQDIIPLLHETPLTTPTNAWAIAEKYIQGEIFSNTRKDPKAILFGTIDGTYFVCGEPDQAFINDFTSFYKKKEEERFTIFSPTNKWDEVIEDIITSNTKKMKRTILHINKDKYLNDVRYIHNSGSFDIHPITHESIFRSNYFNKTYYQAFWGNVDQYVKYGIGFYATNHINEIVSECTSIFRSKNYANIDIHTTKKARGQGMAFHLSKAFIDHCFQLGILPVWDCDCTNDASLNLAKKLGFDQLSEYHLYYKTVI
ncbi:GNAT family N-acetyltransferase [Ornithinibacillus sp. L9]|uniref:GNAT family N-acetyltransferase n=1 Tax=Ornithinibacillus caprae TaxID=2678566 RepID=A0A6N8FRX3_9BACI|nr:GNAT family N-acetyltransferase [Ornithinibacillus caprae]MUK90648.1 GNAT family N-acetyltransferase [Ornithinibacillus caprae]